MLPAQREGTRVSAHGEMLSVDLMRFTQGVSTQKVKKTTDELCSLRFSRQTVSRLAQKLERSGPSALLRSKGPCIGHYCDASVYRLKVYNA